LPNAPPRNNHLRRPLTDIPATRPELVRTRFTLAAAVAVYLFVLGGLVTADRAFARADRAQARLLAVESATLVGNFLAVHTAVLRAFHGLYVPASHPPGAPGASDGAAARRRVEPVTRERFSALAGTLGDHLSGFRRVWVADADGRVVSDSVIGIGATPLQVGLDFDTVRTLGADSLVERARRTGQPQVSEAGRIFSGERGLLILDPVVVAGRVVGFVGGTITLDSLLASFPIDERTRRAQVVVLSGADTVVRAAEHAIDTTRAVRWGADARLPGGGRWQVVVLYEPAGRPMRVALWTVGPLLLIALAWGLMRERRQRQRTAERTAELERLSSELILANRAKNEFLANVSHELRTPLTAIVGFAELLREGVYGELPPRQVSPVQRIEASANHLRHLVDQILDLAKIAAGRLEVHTETLDLRPFVTDVANEVEALVGERALNISLGVPAGLPRVRTDPTHLRQILLNLMGNAVKYTPPPGTIAVRGRFVDPSGKLPPIPGPVKEITTELESHSGPGAKFPPPLPPASRTPPRSEGLWVALHVTDTGIGVAPADQERVFEEFEQVNAGPRGDSMNRGTGLGLPISRRLARLIGGDVTLVSELGKGSTFTLWLPVDAADVKEQG